MVPDFANTRLEPATPWQHRSRDAAGRVAPCRAPYIGLAPDAAEQPLTRLFSDWLLATARAEAGARQPSA